MPILFLGSSSLARQQLLRDAGIPFTLVAQSADETACDWQLPLPQLVAAIATYKMEHVILPALPIGSIAWVLTADTLSQDSQGAIHGKAISRSDAVAKLQAAQTGYMRTGTAFCLEKRVYLQDNWQMQTRIIRFVEARYRFCVPDAWIDRYLDHSMGLNAAGAIAIEGYGSLFLESVEGSYTTIVGLPLFELRCELERSGFF
jgi:septum formation protein